MQIRSGHFNRNTDSRHASEKYARCRRRYVWVERLGKGADEFLELSPEESAYIEMKLELADSLRKRRQRRKLTQIQLAEW